MWLHPPSLLIDTLHLGQSLVLACNQLHVSESSWHFFFHLITSEHSAGTCGSSLQLKHHLCAVDGSSEHSTCVMNPVRSKSLVMRTAFVQSRPGHHLTCGLLFTYVSSSLTLYFLSSALSSPCASSLSTTFSSTTILHRPVLPHGSTVSPAHGMRAAWFSSSICTRRCRRQQSLQKTCPHGSDHVIFSATSSPVHESQHTWHVTSSSPSGCESDRRRAAESTASPSTAAPALDSSFSGSSK
mmetsp:Transcript_18645/g.45861  ORF Transcript_18645/g.45861 Transcript_18645/m.45861 type:complete len:241 (+) Transcript_18645:768-1490(+)